MRIWLSAEAPNTTSFPRKVVPPRFLAPWLINCVNWLHCSSAMIESSDNKVVGWAAVRPGNINQDSEALSLIFALWARVCALPSHGDSRAASCLWGIIVRRAAVHLYIHTAEARASNLYNAGAVCGARFDIKKLFFPLKIIHSLFRAESACCTIGLSFPWKYSLYSNNDEKILYGFKVQLYGLE